MSFSARTRAFGFYLATFILSAWLCPSAAGAADIPPAVPSNPTPADGSIAAANPLFKWESDDPDDIPNYYVYLDWGGPDVWLAFVFNPQFQLPWSLPPGTYTWHIEALANPMVIGPTWKFTVPGPAAANSPPMRRQIHIRSTAAAGTNQRCRGCRVRPPIPTNNHSRTITISGRRFRCHGWARI